MDIKYFNYYRRYNPLTLFRNLQMSFFFKRTGNVTLYKHILTMVHGHALRRTVCNYTSFIALNNTRDHPFFSSRNLFTNCFVSCLARWFFQMLHPHSVFKRWIRMPFRWSFFFKRTGNVTLYKHILTMVHGHALRRTHIQIRTNIRVKGFWTITRQYLSPIERAFLSTSWRHYVGGAFGKIIWLDRAFVLFISWCSNYVFRWLCAFAFVVVQELRTLPEDPQILVAFVMLNF
jgi:hypothetical protein